MESTAGRKLRVPPHSEEAERAVLGSMLLNQEATAIALQMLEEESFYDPLHQRIFSAIKELFNQSRAVDIVTVGTLLKGANIGAGFDVMEYLADIAQVVPSVENTQHYAEIVRDKYILRKLIETSSALIDKSYSPDNDTAELLDEAEQTIFQIAQHRERGKDVSFIGDIIQKTVEHIDELYKNRRHIIGLSTGFTKVDELTSGLHNGDLIVVAGRPSMGKSAFATCIAINTAMEHKQPVAIFSLEMSKEQIAQRILCAVARIDAQKLRTGFLSASDWPRITMTAGKILESPIYIDDTSGFSTLELRAKARRLKSMYGIKLVIVDYLQLMKSSVRAESRQQEISVISRSLKLLAKELDVPVIAVSQLSRAVESRQDKRPQLSDLRESGSIEQDADVVMLLMREEYYEPTEENRGKAEVIIAKQRNGPTGTVDLCFIKEYAKFENLADIS